MSRGLASQALNMGWSLHTSVLSHTTSMRRHSMASTTFVSPTFKCWPCSRDAF